MEEFFDLLLTTALDADIPEQVFWEMTLGEIQRAIESKSRLLKRQAQERASYDYIQATLIVKGVAKVLGDKSAYPTIQEVYPTIFDDIIKQQEEKATERRMELSALRFRQFAHTYNKSLKDKECQADNE